MRKWIVLVLVAASMLLVACAEESEETIEVSEADRTKDENGKADASAGAVFVDLEFDAEVIVSSSWNPESQIENQLLYTIGHLNEENSVGRLDQVKLSNVQVERLENYEYKISYHAILPVAWGDKVNVPKSYELYLPKSTTSSFLNEFADKYHKDCVSYGAHDVDSGSMWYYYRPGSYNCDIAEEDAPAITATVALSDRMTTGKYPEYHKVWEDDMLRLLVVFGKYEDGATTSSDAGIQAYNDFIAKIAKKLEGAELRTVPEEIPYAPGVEHPDVEFQATMPDGRIVVVNALLVDNIRNTSYTFDERYEGLSSHADLIAYNGHAGLGSNVRALAQKGAWMTGQYAIVFMNGCDSYAYVDSALNDAHAEVNADDPEGTIYLDILTNAMPAYFAPWMTRPSPSTMA